MKLADIKLGMEITCSNKKNSFLCETLYREERAVEGRLLRKCGTLGKRRLKAKVIDIVHAQVVLCGFERTKQVT